MAQRVGLMFKARDVTGEARVPKGSKGAGEWTKQGIDTHETIPVATPAQRRAILQAPVAAPAIRWRGSALFNTEQRVVDAVSELLGKPVDSATVAAMVSAQDGAKVIMSRHSKTELVFTVMHDRYQAERHLEKTGKTVTIKNESMTVYDDYQGSGIGTAIFADQVDAAARAGVSRIKTYAAGDHYSAAIYNGYYTWPRLGYDLKIDAAVQRKIIQRFGESFDSTHKLFRAHGAEAIAWWKQNGEGGYATFDLRPRSLARKILAAYLKERAARQIQKGLGHGSEPALPHEAPPLLSDQDAAILAAIWDRLKGE